MTFWIILVSHILYLKEVLQGGRWVQSQVRKIEKTCACHIRLPTHPPTHFWKTPEHPSTKIMIEKKTASAIHLQHHGQGSWLSLLAVYPAALLLGRADPFFSTESKAAQSAVALIPLVGHL